MKFSEKSTNTLIENLCISDYIAVTEEICNLESEIERLYNIIKEVRECIENQSSSLVQSERNIIKILDNVDNKEDKKIETINNFTSNVGAVDETNVEKYIHKLFEQELILYLKINEIIKHINKGD